MELFTTKTAAPKLHCAEVTLRRLVASGQLPYHKIGRRIFFTQSDIDAFLDAAARNQPAQKEAAHE